MPTPETKIDEQPADRQLQPTASAEQVLRGQNSAPILVTGAHRTGTTWVGKMLAATSQAAYISEPLNVHHRPGVFAAPVTHWYTYLHPGNEDKYLPAYRRLLQLDYGIGRELAALRSGKDVMRLGRDVWIFWSGKLQGARPLIKDPFAVFSIPWFVSRLGMQVVVTVRHPAAFASSLMRLNWPFQLEDLLAQPALMHDWLGPYRDEIQAALDRPQDILQQACLLWKMVYSVVAQLEKRSLPVEVVRHEDLSRTPGQGFERLYDLLGLQYTPQARQAVLSSSSADNPSERSRQAVHTVQLDSRANLTNWKKRLTPQEIERIHELIGETARAYYRDEDW